MTVSGAQGPSGTSAKPTLKPDDYKVWESLFGSQISNDGKWLSYQINRVDADGTLILKNSDGPSAPPIANAAGAKFSDDSKWFAFLVSPSKAVAEKLRAEKKPVENKLVYRNLEKGTEAIIDSVSNFSFLKGSRFLVAHRNRGAGKQDGGSDLTVIDLTDGSRLSVGNVSAFAPNHDGNVLALVVESDSGEKGVQIYDPASRSLTPVAWGRESVANLRWAPKTDLLAFQLGTPDDAHDGAAYRVVVASDLKSGRPTLREFKMDRAGFPAGKRIAEVGSLFFNSDGTAVAFGVQEWRPKAKPPVKPEDKVGVEVWNTKDLRVMPEQKLMAGSDANRTSPCVWQLDTDTYRILGESEFETVSLSPRYDYAIVSDAKPYASAVTNGFAYYDRWLVDLKTGEKKSLLTKAHWAAVPSRTGKYITYFADRNWWLYEVATGKRRNLTGELQVPFENREDDHTVPEKNMAGFAIWMKDDQGLVIDDEYDCWLFRPAVQGATKLTDGRKTRETYVLQDAGPSDEEDGPSMAGPFYFAFRNLETKNTGFYTCDAQGKGKKLIEEPMNVQGLIRSKKTDRVLFTMGSFQESPNLFLTNTQFTAIKPESKTNPQQENYAWGKTELISFKSRWGKPLHGTLIYPANYIQGRSYPMVTYIYERLSDGIHNYSMPVESSPYNVQVLSQNGYFVFQPDIAYLPRNPGKSAVDCLEPAVKAVLDKKVGVDPSKVGLIGHSWGGYQTAFVTTVSKTFAVGVAGAPLTELTSMYNSFYWNAGISDQPLIETGQGRMEVPFWEDPKSYFENSPVWQSSKRTAPVLITVGDADGAVDWHQGQYLYQTLRRMGKNAILLVYAGENHNFTRKPDQLDYSRRLRHFLDVYLKGVKPEPWISEGVPYLKRDN